MELTESQVDRKAAKAHQVVDDVARKAADGAAPAIDRVAQAAHETVDTVAEAAAPAAEWVRQSADQIRQQQDALLDSCRTYVRERPLVVLGVALAAGYLAGRLTR
jgi:ElaB/YqjD/DUF883 family membrane-anchored ribosome-binding protein